MRAPKVVCDSWMSRPELQTIARSSLARPLLLAAAVAARVSACAGPGAGGRWGMMGGPGMYGGRDMMVGGPMSLHGWAMMQGVPGEQPFTPPPDARKKKARLMGRLL